MKSIDTAELKESADIVSVVESTGSPVQVKGENILCLCPFHNDRHIGSAMFDEKTGYFHCFACGAGGKGNTVDIQALYLVLQKMVFALVAGAAVTGVT